MSFISKYGESKAAWPNSKTRFASMVQLGQVADRKTVVDELKRSSLVMRAQSYRRRLFSEFDRDKAGVSAMIAAPIPSDLETVPVEEPTMFDSLARLVPDDLQTAYYRVLAHTAP